MKKTLTEQLVFLNRAASTRVDPRARLTAAFKLICSCLKNQDYRLALRSRELAAAARAAAVVLRNVRVLTRLLERRRWACGPDLKELDAMLALLDSGPTHEDVVAAMDFANEALPRMLGEFSRAVLQEYLPESESEEDRIEREYARFKCATLLPLLVEKMETIWLPLRKKSSGVVSKHGKPQRDGDQRDSLD